MFMYSAEKLKNDEHKQLGEIVAYASVMGHPGPNKAAWKCGVKDPGCAFQRTHLNLRK